MWGSVGIPLLGGVIAALDKRPSPIRSSADHVGNAPRWRRAASAELLKPAATDVLQGRPVSRRLNSAKAPADDARLIDRLSL